MRLQVLDSSLQNNRGFFIASTALADRVDSHAFIPVLSYSRGTAYCLAICKAEMITRKYIDNRLGTSRVSMNRLPLL